MSPNTVPQYQNALRKELTGTKQGVFPAVCLSVLTLPQFNLRGLAHTFGDVRQGVAHGYKGSSRLAELPEKPSTHFVALLLIGTSAAMKAITPLCFGSNPTPARLSCAAAVAAASAAPSPHCLG